MITINKRTIIRGIICMVDRIQPIRTFRFKPFTSEVLEYKNGKLLLSRTPLKCLKIIENRFKVYVDYGFKGNARYANDKSDYYVVDMLDNTMLLPEDNDYGSIVDSLQKKAESEKKWMKY